MSLTKSNALLTAAVLLTFGVNANSFAQQSAESEGVVRIRDGKTRSTPRAPNGQRIQQTSSTQISGAAQTAIGGSIPTNLGGQSGSCPNEDCQNGSYQTGVGCDHAQYQGRGCRLREHYCKHSPDYGYSPPAKYPLHRRGDEYSSYYPEKWYGAGGDYIQSQAPMVYQPTDTTQLGFYYQHVPFWQPQPGRIPERPIPAQWHITAPAVSASRFCNSGNGMGGCQNGSCGDFNQPGFRRTLLGSLRNRGFSNGYCSGEWYPADSSMNGQGTSASSQNSAETVRPYGAAPATTGSAPVTPPPVSPTNVAPAPRPIESNPSAMVPLVPGVNTLNTVPVPPAQPARTVMAPSASAASSSEASSGATGKAQMIGFSNPR